MAWVAGLALSFLLRSQPWQVVQRNIGDWLKPSTFAAVVFACIQIGFLPLPHWGTGLVFVWTGDNYESLLYERLLKWGFEGLLHLNGWYHLFAVLDAALAGLVMFVGLAVGLSWANRLYRNRSGSG
jgi:hypothetical protein